VAIKFCRIQYPDPAERLSSLFTCDPIATFLIWLWTVSRPISLPVRKTGIEMKNPPTAQTRVMEDFCRYLFVLWTTNVATWYSTWLEWGHLGHSWKIILKWVFKETGCVGLNWPRTGSDGGLLCECVGGWKKQGFFSKMAVFWVVAPCSLVEVYQRFRGTYCLHHQTTRRNVPETAICILAAMKTRNLTKFFIFKCVFYTDIPWNVDQTSKDC
jgi:hypothetical protein